MRTSLNVPDELLEEFDQVWQEQGIDSRSRAVREAMLEYVEAHTRLEGAGEDLVALVGFDYRHHDVIRELHGVQHDFQDVILNTSHSHQGDLCLESLFCRGDGDRIHGLVNELRDFDAVRRVKVMVIPDAGEHEHAHPHEHVHEAGEPHDHGDSTDHEH
ncbi:CopG family ribbon-helix-helix protein [Salinarchaeum laminariae]|uniref:CopG family ribbon-helix-helix protein n=1 Tax=Salinarchaeum laminariae TaxID=869888 RepID=UPI002872F57D|nr:CopG family ribbon-helix-helix protein [Salinarchaeum laminariae]